MYAHSYYFSLQVTVDFEVHRSGVFAWSAFVWPWVADKFMYFNFLDGLPLSGFGIVIIS